MSISRHPRVALALAIGRIEQQLVRAETELSQLAAPDGTVAIQIDDLRALFNEYNGMLDVLALGKREWGARWFGSAPMKGSHIHTVTEHGGYGEIVAFIGDTEEHHREAGKLVAAHNAALESAAKGKGAGDAD